MSDRAIGSTLRRLRLEWAFGLLLGVVLSVVCSERAGAVCASQGVNGIPAGHVITQVLLNDSRCSGGTWWDTTNSPPGTEHWACRPIGLNYPIPNNKIAVQIQDSSQCGPTGNRKRWRIKDVEAVLSSERMCAVWNTVTFPDGYIVTQVHTDWDPCSTGSSELAFKVETPSPTGDTWGCVAGSAAVWNVPTDYIIAEIDNRSPTCTNGASSLAWKLRKPSGSNVLACLPSTVPPGWVHVTDILSHGICSATTTGSYFRISPISDAQWTCSISGIPSGYVIEDIKNTSVCSPGYKVANLSARPGQETFACEINARPPPNTYIVSETDNYSRCATSGTAVGHKVKEPDPDGDEACPHPAAPIPSSFIVERFVNDWDDCGVGGADGVAHHILEPVLGEEYNVCGSSSVPSGFLYTGSGNKPLCNNTFGYTIGPAVPGALACNPAEIPQDFIIERIIASTLCLPGEKAYEVDRPTTGGVENPACVGSNTPPGFVWVERYENGLCSLVSGTDYKMATPDDTPGTKTEICANSPVPPGFVYTDYLDLGSKCQASGIDAKITVPDPDGETTVCSLTNLPPLFVITQIIPGHSSCAGTAGARIEYPNDDGPTTICDPSVPPVGYEVIETGSYGVCNGGGGSIIQPVNQGFLPEAFDNPEPDVPYAPPAELCPTPGTPAPLLSPGPNPAPAPENNAKCNW